MVRRSTLDTYCQKLLSKKSVISLFSNSNQVKKINPIFEIAKGKTLRTAGGEALLEAGIIRIAEWILSDPDQTRLIIRHELSHLLHNALGSGGTNHGKEFRHVLMHVSGKNYKQDLHWHTTPKINFARMKLRLSKY